MEWVEARDAVSTLQDQDTPQRKTCLPHMSMVTFS
jgi:hypothetical protein